MRPKYLLCGLMFGAALIAALPAIQGIDAAETQGPLTQLPVTHVNRAAKGDQLATYHAIAAKLKRSPLEVPAPPAPVEQNGKSRIMDGCEPSFSPVTMPSMAHIAGRCIG